ncbi:MAG TPA: cupin domain-containing protein [Solirubrobacteraceae bacterium]|nr:cupin domain-containing protein [Solirubrobacteraceae bacterium]
MQRSNILQLEVDDDTNLFGFRHIRMGLTERLGAQSMGASVYSAERGLPTGPFHYHYGVEEWVYVISGAPVLRDHGGPRPLRPGDMVCFPVGPSGAHTFSGPGTFVVFSTGTHREPWMSVYPDSGKVGGPEGILLASSEVAYWYGEGTWDPSSDAAPEPRAARETPRRPIINLGTRTASEPPLQGAPPGYAARRTRLGPDLGSEMLGATLYELDPGEGTAPYHYHSGREEWLLVQSGTPTLRHPDGEDALEAGDVVCFVDGPAGAHRVLNRGSEPARIVLLSTVQLPVSAHYPGSGKVLFRDADGEAHIFRDADRVGYWDGEA